MPTAQRQRHQPIGLHDQHIGVPQQGHTSMRGRGAEQSGSKKGLCSLQSLQGAQGSLGVCGAASLHLAG